jgi:hypothetical protein
VTGVDDKARVTEVSGLGGTESKSHSDTPEDVERSFASEIKRLTGQDVDVKVEYYHNPNPDRPSQEQVERVKKYEKPNP